jgi:hypothetical protein
MGEAKGYEVTPDGGEIHRCQADGYEAQRREVNGYLDDWEVWDLRSGNRLYSAHDVLEMLAWLHSYVDNFGPGELDHLSAGCEDANLLASGDRLRRLLGYPVKKVT